MYRLESTSKDGDKLSYSCHQSIDTSEKQLNINGTTDGDFQVINFIEEVFVLLSTKKRLQLKEDKT